MELRAMHVLDISDVQVVLRVGGGGGGEEPERRRE